MHCFGWCHIVTADLGNFKNHQKMEKNKKFSFPPCLMVFVSSQKPHQIENVHYPITPSPPPYRKIIRKSPPPNVCGGRVFFFSTDCVEAKRSRFRVGHVLGGAYVQGLRFAVTVWPFFWGVDFQHHPKKSMKRLVSSTKMFW